MGHNSRETRIASLAPGRGLEARKVARVELLGSSEPLRWTQKTNGLLIASPQRWPNEHAFAFKIQSA